MEMPLIKGKADKVSLLTAFKGVNFNLQIEDGEFSDMKNMTNESFPVLTNRAKRGVVRNLNKPMGIIGGKCLIYVDDNDLYYDDEMVAHLEKLNVERQIVVMGALVCVFPDNVVYNYHDKTLEKMANRVDTESYEGYTLKMEQCKLDGMKFTQDNTHVGKEAPEDKTKYWLDTSKDTAVLKMYSETLAAWTSVGSTYVKFTLEKDGELAPIGHGFKAYDGVTFSGVTTKGYNNYDFNTANIVFDCGEDYLVVAGLIDLVATQTEPVVFERVVPPLEFIVECDNRLWGCSSANHEIYACKQGDPKNWNCFAGLDSDSYAVTIGSQSDFTGAASFGGYVMFFKEDGYHKLYGTKPSNYEMVWKAGFGVQKGSHKSIKLVNDVLVFKAKDGFYAYDGSIYNISDKLGQEPFYEATAGTYRTKYYVCMRTNDYKWRIYVYDFKTNTWCCEDELRITDMCYTGSGMYMLTHQGYNLYVVNKEAIYKKIFPMMSSKYEYPDKWYIGNTTDGALEPDVEWMFTTGDIGMRTPYRKYLKRIDLRLWLDSASKIKVEAMYDSSDEWKNVMEYYCTKKRSYELPIPIQRCDHLRLRFSGRGDVRLFSIAQAMEEGSGVDGEI